MEKRLNKLTGEYVTAFKNDLRDKITAINFENNTKINELLEFIFDYDRLAFSKEDFIKRKRIKNSIPTLNRCNAKRANDEQCTRRRKDDCEFCGTHSKGTPHGLVLCGDVDQPTTQRIDVFVEEIKGIVYYIDRFNNVYKTEDILEGKENPAIIAKYVITNNQYTIPSLGLV